MVLSIMMFCLFSTDEDAELAHAIAASLDDQGRQRRVQKKKVIPSISIGSIPLDDFIAVRLCDLV